MIMSYKPRLSDSGVGGRVAVGRKSRHKSHHKSQRGSAIVEAALLLPWMFFMFVGILDLGFYYYAMIATQNAARVAAVQVSGSSCSVAATCAAVACPLALAEMQTLPNVNGLTTCTTGTTVTNSAPVAITATPPSSPCAAASANCVYSVTVTYLTIPMIPMPGLLPGRLTIPATVQMQTD